MFNSKISMLYILDNTRLATNIIEIISNHSLINNRPIMAFYRHVEEKKIFLIIQLVNTQNQRVKDWSLSNPLLLLLCILFLSKINLLLLSTSLFIILPFLLNVKLQNNHIIVKFSNEQNLLDLNAVVEVEPRDVSLDPIFSSLIGSHRSEQIIWDSHHYFNA